MTPTVWHRRGAALVAANALLLLGAATARAQDPDPLSRLDPNSRFAIELILDSASTAGLPTRPLMSKVLEGLSRKADGRRIVAVVRTDFGYLKTARATLGGVSEEELAAAAAVLEAGAKPTQLSAFRVRQHGRSDLEAFTDWADLLTRGVPRDDASSAITKLWQDGADDATFHNLWRSVQSDILQGLNPGTALQNRVRETPGGPAPRKVTPPEGQQENQSSR
jgi:hypothetical protein